MFVDVVIVNWNTGHLLYECVESVINFGGPSVSKIIVVDNDSNDDSFLSARGFTQVHFIQAKKNLGFGKACNLGASFSKSEFILFLNPDARVFPDTIKNALIFMMSEENRKVGICGVQLNNENGEIARTSSRFPSVLGLLSQSSGLSKLFPSLGSPMVEWDHTSTKVVDQVIGAFFLVRRHLFETLGGFDEQFFVYYEEVDFAFRANSLGWSNVYYTGSKAFHFGGGSSNQVRAKRLFYSQRSKILYARKHFNFFGLLFVLFGTLLIEPITRTTASIFYRSFSSIKETLEAYHMLYKWLFSCNFEEEK